MKIFTIIVLLSLVRANGATFLQYQDFHNCNLGEALNLAAAQSSAVGVGTWSHPEGGAFGEFTITSNAPFTFVHPIVVGGSTFTDTGIKWLHMDRNNTTTNNEHLNFNSVGANIGGTGGNYQYMEVHYVIRTFNTNATATGANFDITFIVDNPECICQNQTGGAYNFLSHAVNGSNGGFIPYTFAAYEVDLVSDKLSGHCVLKVWDSNGVLIGTSTGTMPAETFFNNYAVSINSSYLQNPLIVTGYVEIGGISVLYQNTDPTPQPAPFR